MFMAPAPTSAPGIDWLTVVVSLIVGLGGGVLSAFVTGKVQAGLARSSARDTAAAALWNFHRTLHDYALELEAPLIRDGSKKNR